MRNIAYGVTAVVGVLLVAIAVGHLPRSAIATQFEANEFVNVRALEATVDMRALPQQDIKTEVYQ